MSEKKVLCSGCNKPIHVDDFGAMFYINGKQYFFHNNVSCLMKSKEFREKGVKQ